MAFKRHKATSKISETTSRVKPESKYLFHTLLSLIAHVIIQTCSRVMFLAADIVLRLLLDCDPFKPRFFLFPFNLATLSVASWTTVVTGTGSRF